MAHKRFGSHIAESSIREPNERTKCLDPVAPIVVGALIKQLVFSTQSEGSTDHRPLLAIDVVTTEPHK